MKTLLLDQATWDLTKDAAGNIALADAPYAIAQDVASAARLFFGELWYDTTQGVPYFQNLLGKPLSAGFLKSQLSSAALRVPEVSSVEVVLTGLVNRNLFGQIQIVDTNRNRSIIESGNLPWYVTAISP